MKQLPIIALVDLSSDERDAFASWAKRNHRRAIGFRSGPALTDHLIATDKADAISLCVLGVDGGHSAPVERIRQLRKQLRSCPIVVIAAGIRIDTVVRMLRAGAADVIGLPCDAKTVVARASAHERRPSGDAGIARRLVGDSPAMRRLRREIRAVAPLQSTVLIIGETGTGKGVVAREIHRLSRRNQKPFIHVDSAALAPSVVESELFGHERGAFTGATQRRSGRFELAAGGTLFLDEIGDLSPPLQAKLLRVLENCEYERIGGSQTLRMTARIIAATHRDLEAMVRRGQFRADLMFRLNVIRLHTPPLRECRGDLPALTRACLERLSRRLDLEIPELSDTFHRRLEGYAWPGNVRELLNVLERILIRHRAGLLDASAAGSLFGAAPPRRRSIERLGMRPDDRYAEWIDRAAPGLESATDPAVIRDVLAESGGNIARAARRLGVPRSTLRYRLRRIGMLSEPAP